MFEKLVAIEPVSLIPSAEEELHRYAKEVVLYRDVPASDDEMVRRIGDADAVLLSYTSRMGKEVIAQCPNIRYIGMCCSLYSEESANVDIAYARTRGIQVLGIRDYGDRGVVEYVLHELTGLLHGFGMPMLRDEPVEITGLKVGIVGLGVSGRMIADALQFMGAEISYFARSAKPDAEAAGMTFKPLPQLLADSEVVFTCLNKNVLLLGDDVINKTIPLILCTEEDVKGSHGASIGQLDEETLFYMQARGISEEQAYALMADARIEAVCQKIPDETAQKLVKAYLGGDAADECEENS